MLCDGGLAPPALSRALSEPKLKHGTYGRASPPDLSIVWLGSEANRFPADMFTGVGTLYFDCLLTRKVTKTRKTLTFALRYLGR